MKNSGNDAFEHINDTFSHDLVSTQSLMKFFPPGQVYGQRNEMGNGAMTMCQARYSSWTLGRLVSYVIGLI